MSKINIPVELEGLGITANMTKEQILGKMAEWARVGQANCDTWKAKAEAAVRQYSWMFALPSEHQPKNTIANMAIRLAKEEDVVDGLKEARTQATCVVGSIKVDPENGEAYFEPIMLKGMPIFGFREPREGEAPMENIISEWVLKQAVAGKIPHRYVVKYHGTSKKATKPVNQLKATTTVAKAEAPKTGSAVADAVNS